MSEQRITIGVVFGGRSSEHSISCISAGSVLRALDRERYEVVPIGITRDGRWVLEADDPDHLRIVDGVLPEVDGTRTPITLPPDPTVHGIVVHTPGSEETVRLDVVFPVLHGPWGEDGSVQGLFEMADLPYVGSGVFSSSAGMDKGHMKAMFSAAGLPVGAFVVAHADEWKADQDAVRAHIEELGLPLFVKPARAGSSMGISKVTHWDQLSSAVEEAIGHDPRLIFEAGIEGAREVECGVLAGPDGPEASVCAEIIVHGRHEFYDFEAKYLDDSADLVVPADLTDAQSEAVRELSLRAFRALGCEGLARVDSFITSDGTALLNEVNTMPGFTSISMFPRMWAESGVAYPELVHRLVVDALSRGTGLR